MGKLNDSPMAVVLFGASAGGPPEVRVSFTLAEEGDGVIVYGSMALVVNPGTAFERPNDITPGNSAGLCADLESIAAGLTRSAPLSASPYSHQ